MSTNCSVPGLTVPRFLVISDVHAMFLKIVINQIRHKWSVALLIFLAMTALVTLYVYARNTAAFSNRSMQLVMKNMGHNLLILPKDADPGDVYCGADGLPLIPADTTRQMSDALDLSSRYYVSVLQKRIEVAGHSMVLTGIEPIARKDETREKRNMVLPLAPEEARLGSEAARKLDAKPGQPLKILDKEFQIVEILPPKANIDDCRVYVNLATCQKLLRSEGQIQYILAFLCLHSGSLEKALAIQRQKLPSRFPGLRQIARMDIAEARHLARLTTSKSLYYLLGIATAVTVIVVAVTGLQEVNDRRHETGIMIAMGVSQIYVVGLYLVKTLALALAASVAGFLLGSLLAVHFTTPFLVVNTRPVTFLWEQLPAVAALTCAVVVAAEIVPVAKLLSLDPSTILTEQ